MPGRLTILCWHNVEGTWCFPASPGAGLRGLARQLKLLRRVARVVPLSDALADLDAGRAIGPRNVALTFDDGYCDHLELAVPLLERLGLPATFFLVPDLLSGTMRAWWEVAGWAFARAGRPRLSWEGEDYDLAGVQARRRAFERVGERLKRRDRAAREAAVDQLVALLEPAGEPRDAELFLGWDAARSFLRRGFGVGSHSLSHAILAQEEPAEQERDLAESRRLLRDGLGAGIELLAYPNGTPKDYSAATVEAARAAGYTHALTMRSGFHTAAGPPYEVPRIGLTPLAGPREWRWSLRDALAG
jgi:peptidoglycan/xylan/chitin deacetylase (PgdA/CDA1 family)